MLCELRQAGLDLLEPILALTWTCGHQCCDSLFRRIFWMVSFGERFVSRLRASVLQLLTKVMG